MQPSDFSLRGAVDLGARQAARQRQEQQRRQPGGSSAYVIDVSEETFNAEVVERSRTVPVIVDFWADWCGPCKQLSPILEKLAQEAAGRWILAKVDVEANQRLAAALRIQGIPFVVAVVGGQLVPLFQGAYPEAQVRQGIDQLFAALRQQGLLTSDDRLGEVASAGPRRDPAYEDAEQALNRGDLDAAAAAFKKILANAPADAHAKAGLAQVELVRRVRSYDEAQVRRAAAQTPGDVEAQCQVADLDLAAGRIEDAFDRLVGLVRRTRDTDREKARRHLIGLFEVLPPGDPRVKKARAALSSALF